MLLKFNIITYLWNVSIIKSYCRTFKNPKLTQVFEQRTAPKHSKIMKYTRVSQRYIYYPPQPIHNKLIIHSMALLSSIIE